MQHPKRYRRSLLAGFHWILILSMTSMIYSCGLGQKNASEGAVSDGSKMSLADSLSNPLIDYADQHGKWVWKEFDSMAIRIPEKWTQHPPFIAGNLLNVSAISFSMDMIALDRSLEYNPDLEFRSYIDKITASSALTRLNLVRNERLGKGDCVYQLIQSHDTIPAAQSSSGADYVSDTYTAIWVRNGWSYTLWMVFQGDSKPTYVDVFLKMAMSLRWTK